MGLLDGIQSALNPWSPDAAIIAEIGWVLIIGSAVIFVPVMALAVLAVFSRTKKRWLGSHAMIIGAGVVFPTIVLTALLVYSLARAGIMNPADPQALRIEVVGEQWWWRVHYLGADGKRDFATANELRLPVGRPAEILLRSGDVLHSFWVPNLAGKLDLVPGHVNTLRVRPERAGLMRGQCAEYCGGPHAFMAFYVVAEPPEAYEAWADRQRAPAASSPVDELLVKGKDIFLAHCAACHTVRGTAAAGNLGPDLTHVGSRVSIGAGLLPNNRGSIAGWIASSQHLKPGNLMPAFEHFSGDELRALAAYVESLK